MRNTREGSHIIKEKWQWWWWKENDEHGEACRVKWNAAFNAEQRHCLKKELNNKIRTEVVMSNSSDSDESKVVIGVMEEAKNEIQLLIPTNDMKWKSKKKKKKRSKENINTQEERVNCWC